MNRKRSLILFGIVLTLLVSVGIAYAQGPMGTGQPRAPLTALGTGFAYQGQLVNNGTPVNGSCDLAFRLYDAASGGNPVGSAITTTIVITSGVFTTQLDFGAGAFTGDARWLDLQARCPTGVGSFTPLSPREQITPVPYALSLPGLYTQQNITSTNVIGGYNGNVVTNGIYGATIGGGGTNGYPNRVKDFYGTVGGGWNNQAGSDSFPSFAGYPTVSGGAGNLASGVVSTVGGGNVNVASNWGATVGGGGSNHSTNQYATIGGGWSNTASNQYAAVGGGYGNAASGNGAFIGGGGWDGTNGMGNQALGNASTIGGGLGNTASSYAATIPGGLLASATHYGEMAYASGSFSTNGDAQTSNYVVRNMTTDATQTELFLDGVGQRITLANNRTMTFDILVVGRRDGGNESFGATIQGVIKNDGGTTALVGSVNTTGVWTNDFVYPWNATASADAAHNALRVQVVGAPGKNIRWVATVRTVEVAW